MSEQIANPFLPSKAKGQKITKNKTVEQTDVIKNDKLPHKELQFGATLARTVNILRHADNATVSQSKKTEAVLSIIASKLLKNK